VIQVGHVLAVIGEAGEADEARPEGPDEGPAAESDEAEVAPIVGTLPSPAGEALPLVRRLARELGVDLSRIRGTGPGGRITREDVEEAAGPASDEDRVRLTKLRRTIAERMARSWREIPHVTTFGEADAAPALAAHREAGVPLEAVFAKAVVPALVAHPEFNASLDGDVLVVKRHYDIGVAIDTDEGLIVAVVAGADRFSLPDLGREIERLTEAVRARTASAQELSGQTFTISNIGAVGGGFGTPIIPFGTTAILSFGRARHQPVVRDGRVEPALILPLSLSYDHRVIDGALGRRFLAAVIEELERSPEGVGAGPWSPAAG
jgi:pyruvate dehydrogenase E2 component (dihydrolipoamide acetyltransferase)